MSDNLRGPDKSCGVLALMALLFLSAPAAAGAADRSWSASLGIGSDYTFRGVSQTMGSHAVHASIDLSLASGLYAYAWGSNVDFTPEGEPDDGASHEIDLAIGYSRDIDDNWSVDVGFVRYLFPGMPDYMSYDFDELMASAWYADRYGATIAYSDSVDGTGAASMLYKLAARFELPAETTLHVAYGHYDVSGAYGSAYAYSEATLARSMGKTEVSLAYVDTSDSAESIYGNQATGPRVVLTLRVDW